MWKVMYLGPKEGFEAACDEIGSAAQVIHVPTDIRAVEDILADAVALLDASMKVRITDEMIRRTSNLKVISCATTGSDHIDREELGKRTIALHTLKEDRNLLQNLTPAAEHTWCLLMACARRLTSAVRHVKEGKWVREDFPGIMLRGKQLGIIGCGRIGTWMARYAQVFGMHVVGYDPYIDPFPPEIEPSNLVSLVETSDFISIHVHLNKETQGFVSQELIGKFKGGAIFINTSRGGVVDEFALHEALRSGRIAAAGLDVLDGEPDIATHPLVEFARDHENLIITPHCAGFSPDAVRIVCRHAAKKILKYLA